MVVIKFKSYEPLTPKDCDEIYEFLDQYGDEVRIDENKEPQKKKSTDGILGI